MALETPETGYVWAKIPLTGDLRVTVVGEIHTWWSHWHRVPGLKSAQAVRCTRAHGVACSWCDGGNERRARYVFPCLLEGELRVVELGRVQFPMLRLISAEGWIGRVILLRRTHAAKNAEIQVLPVGISAVTRDRLVDVSDWVAQLGVGQLALVQPPRCSNPSERSRSEEPSGEHSRGGKR